MKGKINFIYITIAILFFLTVFTGIKTIAQEQKKEEIRQEFCERLKGSKGVFVLVEVMAQEKSDANSLTEEIKKEVEDQLKESKIEILTKEESDSSPGRPRLAINLITYKERSLKDISLYSFRIVHYEIASLLRTKRYVEGTCWDSGLYVGMEKTSSIKKTIKIQLQKYINDYLAANSALNEF